MNGHVVFPAVGGITALMLAMLVLLAVASVGGWILDRHHTKQQAVHRAKRDALPPLPSRAQRRRAARAEVKRQQANMQLYGTIDEKKSPLGKAPVKP